MGATVQVLRGLTQPVDPNLLVGTDQFDDAGVYRLNAETALVLTVDFFPPLVDDPYTFGRIAAANSLSDIYAMGGRPITVLNIVGFPDKDLPIEVLGEILRGGAERVQAAGAVIAGGHSVRDAEIKYGLSVTGIVHPDRILTNGGAQPGDVLVLTKPLGSGILTSAVKAGKLPEGELAEAIDVMIDLNAGACEAALCAGVRGCTDITGFGLLGHAHEMACASRVTIEIEVDRVPLMARTLELARAGIVTRAHKSNLECLGPDLRIKGSSLRKPDMAGSAQNHEPSDVDLLVKVLADAQTSGGLLLPVAQDRLDQLLDELGSRGTRAQAVVGRVLPRSDCSVALV